MRFIALRGTASPWIERDVRISCRKARPFFPLIFQPACRVPFFLPPPPLRSAPRFHLAPFSRYYRGCPCLSLTVCRFLLSTLPFRLILVVLHHPSSLPTCCRVRVHAAFFFPSKSSIFLPVFLMFLISQGGIPSRYLGDPFSLLLPVIFRLFPRRSRPTRFFRPLNSLPRVATTRKKGRDSGAENQAREFRFSRGQRTEFSSVLLSS